MKSSITRFVYDMKRIRIKKGLTQRRLAEVSGLTQTTVYRIEQGSSDPRFASVLAIATVLRMSLDMYKLQEPQGQ